MEDGWTSPKRERKAKRAWDKALKTIIKPKTTKHPVNKKDGKPKS